MGKLLAILIIIMFLMTPAAFAKNLATTSTDELDTTNIDTSAKNPKAEKVAAPEEQAPAEVEALAAATSEEGSGEGDSQAVPSISSASFSTGTKDIDVSLYKGDAAFSIPLASIPGRGGLGYDVSLSYTSDVDNGTESPNNLSQVGLLGAGFGVSTGFIYRDYGTPATGGTDFLIDRSDDTFYISLPMVGNTRLVPEIEPAEKVYEDGFQVKTYRTEMESFAKVKQYLSPNGKYLSKWAVIGSDGTKYFFDHRRETIAYNFDSLNSGELSYRQSIKGCANEADCTQKLTGVAMLAGSDRMNYQWDLTKIVDLKGNEINFEYEDEVRTLEVTRAYNLEVDLECFQETDFSTIDAVYSCMQDVFNIYCDEGSPGQNLCPNAIYDIAQDYIDLGHCPGVTSLPSGNQLCGSVGGTCLPYGDVCTNATVLQNAYFGKTEQGYYYGLEMCENGNSCWRSADPSNPGNLNCRTSQSDSSCTDFGGGDIGPDGEVIPGTGYLFGAVKDRDVCKGYFIGTLDNPKDLQGTSAVQETVVKGSGSKKLNAITGKASASSANSGTPTEEELTDAKYYAITKSFLRINEDGDIVVDSNKYKNAESFYNIMMRGDGKFEMPSGVAIPSPIAASPINRVYGAIEGEDPSTPFCCAGLSAESRGDWQLAGASTCTLQGFTGTDNDYDGLEKLKGQYFFADNENPDVGCYAKAHRNPVQQEYCLGYDVGFAGCNNKMGTMDSMVYSCCVGEVINGAPSEKGQCLPAVPKEEPGVVDRKCSVTDNMATCRESYIATSQIKRITDGAGNKIEFSYDNTPRQDYDVVEPTLIEVEFCPGQGKKVIFSENEHVSTNTNKKLSEVTVFNSNGRQMSRAVFNTGYKKLPQFSSKPDKDYSKLVLESIDFYGTYGSETPPPISFTYDSFNDGDIDHLMVERVQYATGGILEFEYEPIVYSNDGNDGNDDFTYIRAALGSWRYPLLVTCEYSETIWDMPCPSHAGYRVKSKTMYDGFGSEQFMTGYTANYDYGSGILFSERTSNYVGYDDVTVTLPGGFGEVQTWFYNNRPTTELIDKIEADCLATGQYPGGYEALSKNKFQKLADVAYKSESRKADGTVVGSSETVVCPTIASTTTDESKKHHTYQNRLYKQTETIDGITSTSSTSGYNAFNGLPESSFSTNSDGKIIVSYTEFLIEDSILQEDLLAHNILTLPKRTTVTSTDETTKTEYEYGYFRSGSSDRYNLACDLNGGSCAFNLYKTSTWLDDTNNNQVMDASEVSSVEYLTYDTHGNLLETKDPEGFVSKMYYGTNGQCNSETDYLGNAVPTCYEDVLGRQSKILYDELGRVLRTTDPNGMTTEYTYDNNHRMTDVYLNGKLMQHVDYNFGLKDCDTLIEGNENCMNWVKSKTTIDSTANLFAESIEYTDGLAKSIRSKAVADDGGVLQTDTSYNEIAKVETVTEAKLVAPVASASAKVGSKLGYGEAKLSSDTNIATGAVTGGADDADSVRNEYQKTPYAELHKQYPISVFGTADQVHIEYNHRASPDANYLIKSVTDTNGKTTSSKIDKFGQAVEITDAAGNKIINNYDSHGRLLSQIDQEGRTAVTNTYYKSGLLKTTETLNEGLTRFFYDKKGNVVRTIDSLGRTKRFVYDGLGRLTSVSLDGTGVIQEYSYDTYKSGSSCIASKPTSYGMLCEEKNVIYDTVRKYQYSPEGFVMRVSEQMSGDTLYITQYSYDDSGNVKKITMPNADYIEYEYNVLGQLKRARINGGNYFTFDYTDEGMIKEILYPDNSKQKYTYSSRNWMETTEVLNPAGGRIFGEEYLYDNAGNLETMTDLLSSRNVDFRYDDLYQLTDIDHLNSGSKYYHENGLNFNNIHYVYDKVGNRQDRIVSGSGAGIVETSDYTYAANTDQLDVVSGVSGACSYEYDDVGNMETKTCGGQTTTYYFDANNMLYRITEPDGTTHQYKYSPQNLRVYKNDPEGVVKYVYGLNPISPVMTVEGTSGSGTTDGKGTKLDPTEMMES